MIKRKDIKGFTLKIFKYYIEFVFIKFVLRVIEISKPLNKTIQRWEIWKHTHTKDLKL